MNKRMVLYVTAAMSTSPVLAQMGPQPVWVRQFGFGYGAWANTVSADGAGGVYVAGAILPIGLLPDAFLARYDSAGREIWIRRFGSEFSDEAYSSAPDGLGGVYAAGGWAGSPPNDALLARYDSEGRQLWLHPFGTSNLDVAYAAAADGENGVFVAGETGGSVGGTQMGQHDAFVCRVDPDGAMLWARQLGTTGTDWAQGAAGDGAGGVYVAGKAHGVIGGAPGSDRAFLVRYDAAGNQVWLRQFGTGGGFVWAQGVGMDGWGGAYVVGLTNGDLGAPHQGMNDAFVARYDPAGNQLWLRQFGTPKTDIAWSAASVGASGAYVMGWTSGSLGGPAAGAADAFVAHFDGVGDLVGVHQFGTAVNDHLFHGATGIDGSVYAVGHTAGSLAGPNPGSIEAVLARFPSPCYPDCDGNSSLTVEDFACFQAKFVNSDPYADCNQSGSLTIADFACFQSKFVAGCP